MKIQTIPVPAFQISGLTHAWHREMMAVEKPPLPQDCVEGFTSKLGARARVTGCYSR